MKAGWRVSGKAFRGGKSRRSLRSLAAPRQAPEGRHVYSKRRPSTNRPKPRRGGTLARRTDPCRPCGAWDNSSGRSRATDMSSRRALASLETSPATPPPNSASTRPSPNTNAALPASDRNPGTARLSSRRRQSVLPKRSEGRARTPCAPRTPKDSRNAGVFATSGGAQRSARPTFSHLGGLGNTPGSRRHLPHGQNAPVDAGGFIPSASHAIRGVLGLDPGQPARDCSAPLSLRCAFTRSPPLAPRFTGSAPAASAATRGAAPGLGSWGGPPRSRRQMWCPGLSQPSTLNPQPIWWFVSCRPSSTPARPPARAAKRPVPAPTQKPQRGPVSAALNAAAASRAADRGWLKGMVR
jgi:hypothetical protein